MLIGLIYEYFLNNIHTSFSFSSAFSSFSDSFVKSEKNLVAESDAIKLSK